MSGNASRSKGKRGEREAADLLQERGYEVDDLTDGTACADFFTEKDGRTYRVEVKFCKSINLPAFIAQARRQAAKKRWLLMARLHGYAGTWLVIGSDTKPTIWRTKEAAE